MQGLARGWVGMCGGGAHRQMPGLHPNRKGFTSWLSFCNSMGKGQTVGEGIRTSAMFMEANASWPRFKGVHWL